MAGTLSRDGWIDDRPYSVVYDDGVPAKFVCLKCHTETIADASAFASHRCHKAKRPKKE